MKYDRLLTLTVRSAYIWAALVALVGVVLFVVFANSSDTLGKVLSLGGQALYGNLLCLPAAALAPSPKPRRKKEANAS